MRPQRGFTLLEILVALVVLGLLLAGLAQGVRFGLRARDSQSRVLVTQTDADGIDRLLRRLIEQADPGRATVGAGMSGTSRAITFVSNLSAAARPTRTTQSEIRLAVDAGRLVLRWTPYLHAPRLAPASAPSEDVLLSGIDHLEIAYWGAEKGGPHSWRDGWQGGELPDLVRIRVIFPAGDPRHWPPIVAAPMRAKV